MITLAPHTEIRSFDSNYRSEDVRFSPSGRRLAVVATDGCLLLFSVNLEVSPIVVEAQVEFRSPSLLIPHGVEFLGEDMVVVASRNGGLAFFQIPPASQWYDGYVLQPVHEVASPLFGRTGVTRKLRDRDLFCGPGSVRLFNGVLFVTCNYMNTVSTFRCQRHGQDLQIEEGVVIAHEGLSVVDGIALSEDGRLMALSDHDHRRVVVYRNTGRPSERSTPMPGPGDFRFACSLTDFDMHFPHGLRFGPNGTALYAVDAGGRYIHAFRTRDDWQSDIHHSTVKTFGIDLGAFHKSQQAVKEAHRILEGGGKGLDIDPSARFLVVTCRNQSLRFFELDPSTRVSTSPPAQAAMREAARSEVALSCLVDDTPGIWRSLMPWLATATRLANIAPEHIHVHHVCELPPDVSRLCGQLGVRTHAVSRFDERNSYANKIIQGDTDFGLVNRVVLTDVDVVFTAPVPFEELRDAVAGKSVDMENPPLELLENLFREAGVPMLGLVSNGYSRQGVSKVFNTAIGNFNGGFYCIPRTALVQLSKRWGVWVRWLLSRTELMERWAQHVDQIGFCLALNDLRLPAQVLTNRWNYPTHLDLPPLKDEPWVLHHHAALDPASQLAAHADPSVHLAVRRVNHAIASFMQEHGLHGTRPSTGTAAALT